MFQITVTQDGRTVSTVPIDYEPSCVSINQENGNVAIGSTSDNTVRSLHVYFRL